MGITLVATVSLFVLNDARRREAEARGEAEANFKMALNAVDNYLTNVSENTLLKEQDTLDIRTLRQDLLMSALPFYKRFVDARGHDPQLREQLANAYFRLGDITRMIGSQTEALGFYRSALQLWEPLAASTPGNTDFQARLADCCLAIGKLTGDELNRRPEVAQARRFGFTSRAPLSGPTIPGFSPTSPIAARRSAIAIRP